MTTSTSDTYTTYGSVRGDCGHQHQTHEAAQRCADRDMRGCRRAGGYSDRLVYAESEVERNAVGDVYAARDALRSRQ
jgi:hypothetical protein